MSVLSVRPKYDQLIELLDTLVNWQKFGTFLPGIESEHIQVIERDIRGTDLQKAALFSKWFSVHPDTSWQDVLFGLEKSQQFTLASKVYQAINITSSTASSTSQGITNFCCYYDIIFYIVLQVCMSVEMVKLEDEVAEKEIKSTIVSLDKYFSDLMVAVRLALDHKLQHQQLLLVEFTTWIEQRMDWVGQLNNIKDLNKIFQKLHPYFDFIDCDLIVDMSERFLNDEYFGKEKKSLVSELKEHMTNAETLRCSSTVKELKLKLKSVYSQYLADLSNMPKIHIELNNKWNEATIKKLYLLIGHLLPYKSKQSILNHIEIETGSVYVKYVVIESNADCLIAYAQDKLQFMRLIGIFGLRINGEPILEEDENMNFTFESALLEAANIGHNEAVQFLLKLGGDVDHYNEKRITALMLASKSGHEQIVLTLISAGTNINIQDNEGWTALMIASENGHTQVVEQLLKEHAEVNVKNKEGVTALLKASEKGHTEVVEQLLKEHADVNIQDNEGWTALLVASLNGHTQVVKQLLKENADVNIQKKSGWTALMIASHNGDTQVVEQLLKEHADVTLQNNDGWTALMITIKKGHTQVIEQLCKENADVNIQNKNGWTALMIASQNGHTQAIEQLLKEHADVNLRNNNGSTALMIASERGHTQVVEQLLKEHADVNIQNNDGWTALMIVSQNGDTQVVEQLLKEDADVNLQNNNGSTALMLASQNDHTQVVEQQLKDHANINIQNKSGWTALVIASQNGHTKIVEQLLKEHADVNIQNKEGVTALMKASENGHTQVVEQLLKEHPYVNIQNKSGWTALMIASQNGHTKIVEQLLKEDADVNIQNKKGVTALMLASANGQTQVVELLTKELIDIDVQMKDGYTALILACRNGHIEVAECLLQSFADPHIIAYNGATAFSLAAYSGNRDLVNMLLDKAEPTTDEIEKAIVTSCYGGHPTLITFLSIKLPHLTNDQRELLDSCVKGDLGAVIMKTLDSPDTPLVLGLTPLMVASSCGHVDIVDALIQAGADVNKQESHFWLTPLFFAVRGSKSSSIVGTLLMYDAHPNVIVYNSTPLDVAIDIKKEAISELLISCGGQTISQLQGKKKYELSDLQSLLSTLGEEATTKSLLTTDDITMYEKSSYTLKRETKKKTIELQSFTSLTSSFT